MQTIENIITILIFIACQGAMWCLFAGSSLGYKTYKHDIAFQDIEIFLERFPKWFQVPASGHKMIGSSYSKQTKINVAQGNRFVWLIFYLGCFWSLIYLTMETHPIVQITVIGLEILGLIVGWRFGHSLIKKKTESSD